MEPAPPNRFERRRQRNRAAILDAALELFQKQGVRATRIEEVCERADVAPRTFFNHFETREHLYQAIARQRATQLAAVFDILAGDPRPLEDRLVELFAATGRYLSARPLYRELVGVMLRLGVDGRSEVLRTRTIGQAGLRFVVDGVGRGEITRRHAPEVLADILIGTLNTALANWSSGEDYDLEKSLGEAALALLDLFTPSDPESGAGATH